LLLGTTVLLSAFALPVFATNYNPGVTAGQYVKFGNFDSGGVGPYDDYDWLKIAVESVSGKEVTILITGQLKNGNPTSNNGSTYIWNIEDGTVNGELGTKGPIIAANLNADDAIPPPSSYTVTKTENRIYLGTSRTVNILTITSTAPTYTDTLTYVYDRASGMLLEMSEVAKSSEGTDSLEYTYSIIETNIFASGSATPTPTPQQTTATSSAAPSATAQPTGTAQPNGGSFPLEYLAVAVVVIVVVLAAVLVLRKRNR